jgi:putative transposase
MSRDRNVSTQPICRRFCNRCISRGFWPSDNICSFQVQQIDIEFPSWGGQRDGAGRKASPRGNAPHRRRERHRRAHPVHVTLRARRGLPPFREQVVAREIRLRIAQANGSSRLRDVFRIVHFSAQNDHLHFIVEALDASALSRGVQGLAIRLARRVNALLATRGRIWADRFHSRELTTPRSVRNAIVYVLMNAKKHMRAAEPVDTCSSAPWFDGFAHGPSPPEADSPVRPAATWLGSTGWKRHGLVGLDERPRAPS